MTERQGLVRERILTEEELEEIQQLATLCAERDTIAVRLNWDIMRSRSGDVTNDFLYYERGELVGYLSLYSFSRREAELSGIVHPDLRRQGLFRLLFQMAQQECAQRGIEKLLLFFDRASASGQAFARSLGAHLDHTEYKMELHEEKRPAVPVLSEGFEIRPATVDDVTDVIQITAISFEMEEEELRSGMASDLRSANRATYLGILQGKVIGAISMVYVNGASIYGFGVLPEYRGRGYGRQMLAWTVDKALTNGKRPVTLEVAPENEHALSLYHSCGFRETTTFDYYAVDVRSLS